MPSERQKSFGGKPNRVENTISDLRIVRHGSRKRLERAVLPRKNTQDNTV